MGLLFLALFIYIAIAACKFIYRIVKSDYFGSTFGHILRTVFFVGIGIVILWIGAVFCMWAQDQYNTANEITQLKWAMACCTLLIVYSIHQVGTVLERKLDRIEYRQD